MIFTARAVVVPPKPPGPMPRLFIFCSISSSKCIKKSELVCYGDLGAEAILKLEVEDFPVIVVVDREGNNLYETAIKEYASL